jgi:signal transduction histidine kinase
VTTFIGRSLGAAVAALGLVALAGWTFDREVLTELVSGSPPLKVNTALCFVALGTAVVLRPTGRERLRTVLAAGAASVAAATLVEHSWSRSLGIDELLFDDRFSPAGSAGRMSVGASIALLLAAVGLLALDSLRRKVRIAAQVPLVLTGGIGLVGLVGYASGLDDLYWRSDVTTMAIPTAAGILALGVAALALAPVEGAIAVVSRPSPGGRLLRRLLPVVVLVPTAFLIPIGRGAGAGWFGFDVGVLLFLIGTIAVSLPVLLWTARSLDVADGRRRTAEAEREQLLAQSRAVLDAATDAILMTDVEGHVLFSNAAMDAFWVVTGLGRGGTIWDRIDRLSRQTTSDETYRNLVEAVSRDPEAEHVGEFTLAESGRSFVGRTASVRSTDGVLMGRIFSLRETTTERAAGRAKDEFVATVSHELRTPLAAIAGYVELLEDDVEGAGREFLTVIQRNAERLQRLVDDLLLVQQWETREVAMEVVDVDVDDVIRHSLERVRSTADRKSIVVSIAGDSGVVVRGDAMRLGQIVDNLLSNAVKFTPDGGTVTVAVWRGSLACAIEVSDSGPGIADDERGRVFERFFRSRDAVARSIPGTGLGLVIARRIAEAHGGALELVDREGAGAVFRLLLPFASAPTESSRAA